MSQSSQKQLPSLHGGGRSSRPAPVQAPCSQLSTPGPCCSGQAPPFASPPSPQALVHHPQHPDFPVTRQRPAETCISQEGFPGTLASVTCTSVTGVFIFLISCSLDVWGYRQGSLEPPNLHKSLQHRRVPLDGMCQAGRQHR